MIEVRDVHKRFGGTDVLRGVSLAVDRGEVSVLLGPSGSGKSTLLRTINGLVSFDDGEIRVSDLVLRPGGGDERVVARIRRRVGMVFQQFHLFPHMNVLGNVTAAPRFVLRVSREQAEAEAEALLRRVGLGDKLRARPSNLSGGQQQRVAIARALAMKPDAILFDEPTSALDPRMSAEVMSVMVELAAEGQTMIVVTHSLTLARAVATRVHVMHDGRIAESGTPDVVLDSPAQRSTREFLDHSSSPRSTS